MRRVLAQTAYPATAASPRVRLATFVPHLREHGVDLRYAPALSEDEYRVLTSDARALRKAGAMALSTARLIRARRPDPGQLLLIHRLRCLSPLPGIDPPTELAVYDFDDALYAGSISASNRRFASLKREAERWAAYVARARLVLAGNRHLADRAAALTSHVEVVPSCVDPSLQPVQEHGPRQTLRIGWIGSRSTSAYLDPVVRATERLSERGLGVKLVLIGAGPRDPHPLIEERPWSLDRERADLAGFDVGVMPLPDDEWTRGKCGYKLLQYFSAGVPAVASPVGVNPGLIGDDRGLLADTVDEWVRAIESLAEDDRVRQEMGSSARRFVEAEYSYQVWAPRLAALLHDL